MTLICKCGKESSGLEGDIIECDCGIMYTIGGDRGLILKAEYPEYITVRDGEEIPTAARIVW